MPNTGRPSGGCNACRRMKVKCDERHPVCSRCAKAKRECKWRAEPDNFLSMNDVSEQRALRPPPYRKSARAKPSGSRTGSVKSRSNSPGNLQRERSSSVSTAASSERRPSQTSMLSIPSPEVRHPTLTHSYSDPIISTTPLSPLLNRPLPSDWPAIALSCFISDYTRQPDPRSGTEGHMEYLPELLSEAPEDGFLREAARAVAFVALGNRVSIGKLNVEGSRSFGRAISGLRTSLGRGETGDDVLGGTLLLSRYQLLCGDETTSPQSHADVQPALILSRGQSQFSTHRGRALCRDVLESLQMIDIALRRAPALLPPESFPDIWLNPRSRHHAILKSRVASSVYKADQLLEGQDPQGALDPICTFEGKSLEWWIAVRTCAEESWAILASGEELENTSSARSKFRDCQGLAELELASSTIESQHPHAAIRSSSPTALPQRIFAFPDLTRATQWASMWMALIKLIEALLALHVALDSPACPFHSPTPKTPYSSAIELSALGLPDNSPASVLSTTQRSLAEKLLASFPYLLNEVDQEGRLRPGGPGGHGKSLGAISALWLLHVLAETNVLLPREREWTIERIEHIGKIWGIRQADALVGLRRGRQIALLG